MPEGDSVWRTGRRLNRGLAEQVIVHSDFRVAQHATADVNGPRVLGTETHGKHLFTRFDGDVTLHTHLRMDGEWTVLGPGKRLPRRLPRGSCCRRRKAGRGWRCACRSSS